ncbi:queuosine precursor transporter [Treponema parvum]|uniref:queuosine precursor transporter n=1 Tax=Treponema parvum TaxID=138851 RepID=UPI001AEC32B7|nr:queuosine precursor transporter [Treponema parvum]QTQ16210.1 queuosine precursor transporter [Treponema parvum]
MPNEILLCLSLLFSYGGLLVFFKLFGKAGLYTWMVFTAITANIEVLILVNAFGLEQTLGNTLFAASFLATDILSEIYGKKSANKAVFIGIAVSASFIVITNLWLLYTPSPNDWVFPSIKTVFSNTPRIMTASLIGYAVSEIFDVWAYHAWWNFTQKKTGSKEKFLWLRNNGSTLVSQFINIVIFNFLAFWKIYDLKTLINITASCYIIYIFTSLLDTPFIYLAKAMRPAQDK